MACIIYSCADCLFAGREKEGAHIYPLSSTEWAICLTRGPCVETKIHLRIRFTAVAVLLGTRIHVSTSTPLGAEYKFACVVFNCLGVNNHCSIGITCVSAINTLSDVWLIETTCCNISWLSFRFKGKMIYIYIYMINVLLCAGDTKSKIVKDKKMVIILYNTLQL
jgi:hypothetical protein